MSEQRDAETWDGAKVADAMVVRGDLTIGDLMQEEIAMYSPEAQAVLREQAAAKLAAAPKRNPYPNHPAPPKRRVLSVAGQTAVVAAAVLGATSRAPLSARVVRQVEQQPESRRQFKQSRAEAKRQRKAARRRTPATASVGRCMDCNRTIAECDKALCSRTHNQGEARGSRE